MKATFLKIAAVGIFTALSAAIAQQFFAVLFEIILQKKIDLSFQGNLGWFIALAVVLEEGLKYASLKLIISDVLLQKGRKLIWSGLILGLSYGIAEALLILYSDREIFSLARNLDKEIIFSLVSVAAIQTLTAIFMGAMISSQEGNGPMKYFHSLAFPIFAHLLYNFLVIQKGTYTMLLTSALILISFIVSITFVLINCKKLGR